jgi:Domain of unknown function (DUF4258)
VRITYLPHARRRMEERGISEEEVDTLLEAPALEYLGNLGRTVAERILPGRRLAVKVVCKLSAGARESSSHRGVGSAHLSPTGQERGEQWHTD